MIVMEMIRQVIPLPHICGSNIKCRLSDKTSYNRLSSNTSLHNISFESIRMKYKIKTKFAIRDSKTLTFDPGFHIIIGLTLLYLNNTSYRMSLTG